MTEVKSPKYNLEICEAVIASPDAIGMWQSLMPSYIGIKKAENNTLCHSGEACPVPDTGARIQTRPHPPLWILRLRRTGMTVLTSDYIFEVDKG